METCFDEAGARGLELIGTLDVLRSRVGVPRGAAAVQALPLAGPCRHHALTRLGRVSASFGTGQNDERDTHRARAERAASLRLRDVESSSTSTDVGAGMRQGQITSFRGAPQLGPLPVL